MKYLVVVLVFFLSLRSQAQREDLKTLQETAANFIKQADYGNAVLVLNQALQQAPENQQVIKDLAWVHFLQRDYNRALNIIK